MIDNNIEGNNDTNLKLVLVAEDDHSTNFLIERLLVMNGYRCASVYTGLEVIEHIKEETPDLILMDIMMPELDGIETTKRLLMDEKHCMIPVIFLTANNEARTVKEVFDIGAFDYITKPFNNLELIARIKSAIKYNKERLMLANMNRSIEEKSHYFEKQNTQLKKIDEMKDNYIASVTHDFKTPLTSIRSISEMLLDNKEREKDKVNNYLHFIIDQVDNLKDMIEHVLSSVKKITAVSHINKTQSNIKELCCHIFENYKLIGEAKGLVLRFEYDSVIEEINCDILKIRELLDNLFSNAIKFTEDGEVYFRVFQMDDKLYFAIKDTGPGIKAGEIASIFEKFYRITETSQSIEGHGLGLYIAKKIAQAHNGDIFQENNPDSGSTFTFYLPV